MKSLVSLVGKINSVIKLGDGKLRVQVEQAHDDYMDLLKMYKPNERVMKLFDHLVFSEWDKVLKSSRTKQRDLRKRIEQYEADIDLYLERYERGDYTKAKKDKKVDGVNMEIALLEEELDESRLEQYDKQKLRGFTEFFCLIWIGYGSGCPINKKLYCKACCLLMEFFTIAKNF